MPRQAKSELPELPFALPLVDETASPQELTRLRATRQPFVIRRALAHWALHRELDAAEAEDTQLEWLRSSLGAARLHWTEGPWGRGITPDGVTAFGASHREFSKREGSSAEFVAALRRRPTHSTYLKSVPLAPGLLAKVGHVECLAGTHVDRVRMWIGSGGHVSNLHYDPFNNLLGVAAGIKRVVLFPLSTLPDLYPTALDRGLGARPASWVVLRDWDRRRFPRFARALESGVQAIVGPGDALWIPPYWWHHVESFGLNVMVNCWSFDVPLRTLAQLERALIGAMRDIGEHPRAQRAGLVASWFEAIAQRQPYRLRQGKLSRWFALGARAFARIVDPSIHSDWLANQRSLFEHWVAGINGDPIATTPGEYERMIARLSPAWWPWFRTHCGEAASRWHERDHARLLTNRISVFPRI